MGGDEGALANSDVGGAISYFGAETIQHYSELFTSFQSQLPEVVQELQGIELVRGSGGSAVYTMSRAEQYGGQTVTIDYSVYFVIANDGLWKIDWF